MPGNDLIIRIGLEIRGLREDLRRMRTDFQRSFSGVESAAQKLRRVMLGLFTGFSATAISRSILRVGVEMDSLRRRLRAVSDNQQEFADSLRFVRSEADRLGQNFQELLRSYIDFRAAAQAANLDLRTTREIFSAFSDAITVLGLSTEETGRIFLALRQMISGGVLQMQELNQIAESLPGAIDVFAQAMGVSVQELRKLTSEARINAAPALVQVAQVLRERFGRDVTESAKSARAAFNRLNTAWQQLADAIATSGVLDSLVAGIDRLRQVLTDPAVIDGVRNLTTSLTVGLSEAVRQGGQLVKILALIKTTAAGAKIGGRFGPVGALVGGLTGAGVGMVAIEEIGRRLKNLAPASKQASDAAERYTEQVYKLRQQLNLATAAINQWYQALEQMQKSGNLSGIEHARKELERWRFIAAEVGKQLKALAGADRQRPQETTRPPPPATLPPPIAEKADAIDLTGIRKQLRQIDAEILKLQGRTVEAAKVALETQFADLVEKLRKIGDQAGLAKVQKLIDLSVAREQLDALRDRYARFRDQVGQMLDQVNQKVQLGILSQRAGQAELARVYRDAIDKLRRFQDQATNLPGSEAFITELQNAVLGIQGQLQQLQDQFGQFFRGLRDDLEGAFSSLFVNLMRGTDSLKDALLSFVRSISESIQRRLADQAAKALTDALIGGETQAAMKKLGSDLVATFSGAASQARSLFSQLFSSLGGLFRSLGGALSGLFTSTASQYHDGRGYTKRIVGVRGPVPVLHNGLAPDEFMAVLQRGEVVLPKNLVKQVSSKGATPSAAPTINVTNHFIIPSPTDRSSQEQIAAKAGLAISRAIRRIE